MPDASGGCSSRPATASPSKRSKRPSPFVAERGLPRPELNAHLWVDDRFYSPDCLWREQRVIVELHSVRHHGTGPAISRDATRDRHLLLAGWRVIHVTWAQLHDRRESAALERDLRRVLGCDP